MLDMNNMNQVDYKSEIDIEQSLEIELKISN